jgi:nucleoside-diphosphate-sugar epimerase
MSTTLLITGANGFVGSHILEAAQYLPDVHLIAACRDPQKLPPGFGGEIRPGDLRDPVYIESLVRGVDVICHAAAWSSLWGHDKESRELFLQPSLALIEAARKAGVKRFINTSTTSAAAPDTSADAMSRGIPRAFWPHLCNVIRIENALREQASETFRVANLRLGIFAGQRYSLGVLPILTPRLKTHLVPFVAGGKTSLPVIDGRDIGQAFARAVNATGLSVYESFNIVGPDVPRVRDVINFLHEEYDLPKPHFSVPFFIAYPFAWLMEKIDPIVPWEPLVTRSIIHLMEEVNVSNDKAQKLLGYQPRYHWRDAIRLQMAEMKVRQIKSMAMIRPI